MPGDRQDLAGRRAACTTIPPSWPPSAVTAARCSVGETVVRTGGAGCGRGGGEHTRSRQQLAAGGAAQAIVERQLEAAEPDDRLSAGTPCASSAWRRAAGHRPDGAEHRVGGDAQRRVAGALRPSARRGRRPAGFRPARCRRAPAASRARGSEVSRLSSSPGRRPGNASERDHAMRGPAPWPSSTVGSVKSSDSTPEQTRGDADRHRRRRRPRPRARGPSIFALRGGRRRQRLPGRRPRIRSPRSSAARRRRCPRTCSRSLAASTPSRTDRRARIPEGCRGARRAIAPTANATAASTRTGRARRMRWLRLSVTELVEHDR